MHKALELGKEHGKALGISFILIFAIIFIAFSKESIGVVLRLAGSMFWLYVVPGYFLLGIVSEKFDHAERIVLGTIVGIGAYGALGYNLGLLGVKFSLQRWIVPIIEIGAGIIFMLKRSPPAEESPATQGKEEQ
ncbi:hypothetical protein HYV84_06520 [Candidatus Woesearchaeota archaeon]|nr:hypothetical protein [Candidatus Woesearchaeota archaeon]